MSRLSWVLLLAAIVAATATVTVIAAFGPEWPDVFADCSGEESVRGGGPPRAAAITAWKAWWDAPFAVGLLVSSLLAAGWAVAARWRPRRRTVAALVVIVLLAGVALAIQPAIAVVALAVVAFGWSYLLSFPDQTAVLAPLVCLVTLGLSTLAIVRFERPGQRTVQLVLAALLVSAWVAFALTGFPANGAFAC